MAVNNTELEALVREQTALQSMMKPEMRYSRYRTLNEYSDFFRVIGCTLGSLLEGIILKQGHAVWAGLGCGAGIALRHAKDCAAIGRPGLVNDYLHKAVRYGIETGVRVPHEVRRQIMAQAQRAHTETELEFAEIEEYYSGRK